MRITLVQNQPMHPVAHAVEIPLDQLERILLDHAREDFQGSVEIEVRLLPDSVKLIEMRPETREFQAVGGKSSPQWEEIGRHDVPKPPVDREAIVRRVIQQSAGKLRLACSVRKIVAHFTKGELRGNIEWVMPG